MNAVADTRALSGETVVWYGMAMEDTTLAWLAALIDGEGSVMLIKRAASSSATNAMKNNTHYRARVAVYNTDKRLMDALVERTGIGRVYTHTRAPKHNHKKTSYRWTMVAQDVRRLGPRLLPWLVCKQEQMVLLLEALEIADRATPRKGEKWARSEEDMARRDEIYAEIRRMNTRGRETLEEETDE